MITVTIEKYKIVASEMTGLGWVAVQVWNGSEYKHLTSFRTRTEAEAFIRKLIIKKGNTMEKEYKKLDDGSIHIDGLNIEAHIAEDGTIYDADKVVFGELTEDKTRVILWSEEEIAHRAIADNAATEGLD